MPERDVDYCKWLTQVFRKQDIHKLWIQIIIMIPMTIITNKIIFFFCGFLLPSTDQPPLHEWEWLLNREGTNATAYAECPDFHGTSSTQWSWICLNFMFHNLNLSFMSFQHCARGLVWFRHKKQHVWLTWLCCHKCLLKNGLFCCHWHGLTKYLNSW